MGPERRAGLHAAGTTQLKKKSRSTLYPTAINLPVDLCDYVFDVPPADDASRAAEHTRRRDGDATLRQYVQHREKIMESRPAGIPMKQQVPIPTVPIIDRSHRVRA